MLMLELMAEAARRYGSGPGWIAVIGDAGDQSRHGMDAPDTVQDGMEWFADDDPEVCGPVPRLVELREPPNVEFSGVPAGHSSNHPAGGTSAGTQG